MYLFFFFKQKTAYEMRISDWSSDVCSSDLAAQAVHEKFLAALAGGHLPDRADAPDPATAGLSRSDATDIFLSQLTSRQMDRLSRHLHARGEGFYTIGSSGHEEIGRAHV